MFEIGQKVVCIKQSDVMHKYIKFGIRFPVVDKTYTIRGFDSVNGRDGILLEEIINEKVRLPNGRMVEILWDPARFRPLELDYGFVEEVLERIREQETVI